MTELTFLIDLLLDHKLMKPTRDAIKARIKDVEIALAAQQQLRPQGIITNTHEMRGTQQVPAISNIMANQSPSTIAAMMRHAQTPTVNIAPQDLSQMPTVGMAPQPEPQPVAIVAQTPQAAMAVASRQQAIAAGISGKPEPGRTSPRKF